MDKKIISIYIQEDTHTKAKVAAAKRKITLGQLIEEAVKFYLKEVK